MLVPIHLNPPELKYEKRKARIELNKFLAGEENRNLGGRNEIPTGNGNCLESFLSTLTSTTNSRREIPLGGY